MFSFSRKMRVATLAWWILCCGYTGFAETNVPSVLELQRRHVTANGGLANMERLTTLVIYGSIIDAEGAARPFKLYKKRPNLMRMQIEFPQGTAYRIYDGSNVYEKYVPMNSEEKVKELDTLQSKIMHSDAMLEGPFFQLRSRPEWLEVVSETVIEGVPAYEIAISEEADSPYARVWLDRERCQEIKLVRRLEPGSDADTTEEVYFSDFEKVDGVWFTKSSRAFKGGELVHRVEIDHVRSNVGIFDSYFRRPKL